MENILRFFLVRNMLEVEFNSESESDHEAMVRIKQFVIENNVQKTFNAITFFLMTFFN